MLGAVSTDDPRRPGGGTWLGIIPPGLPRFSDTGVHYLIYYLCAATIVLAIVYLVAKLL